MPLIRNHCLCALVVCCTLPLLLSTAVEGQEKNTPATATAQNSKAHQDGQIWGALVFATAEKIDASKNRDIQKTLAQLSTAFPDNKFQLLGEHTQQIFSEYESWVVPSKDVFLKIDSKGRTKKGDGVNLHLQLWHEKNVLLKTDIVLRKEPIFITGPKWGKGKLIMVVELR